jgi:hypothetical protein
MNRAMPPTAARWWSRCKANGRCGATGAAFPEFVELPTNADAALARCGTPDGVRGHFDAVIADLHDHGLTRCTARCPIGRRRIGRRQVASPHGYTNHQGRKAVPGDEHPAIHTMSTAIGWTAHGPDSYVEWYYTSQWPSDGH